MYIPKLYNGKNKTFFFFSEEFRKVITYQSVQGTAPTADEKKGIFATPVCVAYTGSTCTETSTTIARIDPVAQAYIKDIFNKIPDAPASHLINTALRNVFDTRQEIIKIDQVFNEKWNVAGRYIQDSIPTIEPRGLFTGAALPDVSTTKTNSPGKGVNIRVTGNISPTIVNEAGYSYSYGAITSDPIGLDASVNSPDINLKLPFAVTLGRIPTLNFGGVSSVTGYGPYRDYNRNHTWFDNVTKIAGRHTFKVGLTVNKYNKYENAAGNNVGSFTFATTPRPTTATTTQQGWANFLLGNVSQFTQLARDITPDIHQNQVEMYFQDDFRIQRNLTINLGLRYSLLRQPTDGGGYLNTFIPELWDPAKAPKIDAAGNLVPNTGDPFNGQVLAGKNSPYGSKIARDNNSNFAPRFGFSWDPFKSGRTAIRGGYGISYDTPPPGRYEDPINANPISVQSVTITNTTFGNVTGGSLSVPLSPPALTAIGDKYQTPYSQQYSLGIQRQLLKGSFLDVSFVGSRGTHLWGEPDINQVQPGTAASLGLTDADSHLTTTIAQRINAYRPYPGYRAINIYQTWFNSNYNSLQAMFKQRLSRGGFVNVNYTWGKTLTNAGSNAATPQNFYARNLDYGISPYDRKHVFSANWNYELPFFQGNHNAVVKMVLAGWQTSTIVSAASGLPVNASTSSLGTDPAGLGLLGSGTGAGARPDAVCEVNNGAPHTQAVWFNTQCLKDVPSGVIRPGNAPRNAVRAPGYQKWDISAFKNFRLKENGPTLQFRAESFNTFNHTNWASIGATVGSSTYGQITAARDPRLIQFALKMNW